MTTEFAEMLQGAIKDADAKVRFCGGDRSPKKHRIHLFEARIRLQYKKNHI